MKKTQAERRSKINHELFDISSEMQEAMDRARNNHVKTFSEKKTPDGSHEKGNFRSYDQDQNFFITISKERFLDAEHPAVIIDLVVERLDLSELYKFYSDEGNPAFHPKMMLKVLFYSYYVGIMSCRTIWDSVVNRADFIYLAAGQVPNFRTINSFRLRHLDSLVSVFTQIVMMCRNLGMIDFNFMAVDGQKIQANASYRKSKNLKGIKKELGKIKEGMKKLLNKDVNEDFTKALRNKRLKTLSQKIENLEDFQKELEKLNDEEKRINMVDPDAPVMAHKDGQKLPSYSHQSARDEKYGVITAVQTTANVDVPEDLLPLVDQSISNTGEKHNAIAGDCGFCNYDILQKIEEERTEDFYVPDRRFASSKKKEKGVFSIDRFKKNNSGEYICPAERTMEYKRTIQFDDGHLIKEYLGTGCSDCLLKEKCTKAKKRKISIDSRLPFRDKMRAKLRTDRGREIYRKRQGLIEPVHGDDQRNKGWIQHHLRGIKKAAGEFLLIRIATNLATMIEHKSQEILAWN